MAANNDQNLLPAILGCSGDRLTAQERDFFAAVQPAGFILFARNIENPQQVAELTAELRATVGGDTLILVDQEGGRVQRMAPPHWRKYCPIGDWGHLTLKDPQLGARGLRLHCRLIGNDLAKVGINVNCLPLLDVPQEGSDIIIGDRALSADVQLVSALGRIVTDSLREIGILPVIKHIPGHGRAAVDSHLDLPVVDTPLEKLRATDFAPFIALSDEDLAMTAHIIYSDVDSENCATHSSVVIGRAIRMIIGFSGLLMSDDLSMQALKGSMTERTDKALKAGCDLVLHCNGNMDEMQEVAKAADFYRNSQLDSRQTQILNSVTGCDSFDEDATFAEYCDILDRLGVQLDGDKGAKS